MTIADVEKAIKRSHIQGTIDGVQMAFDSITELYGQLPSDAAVIRDGLLKGLHERLTSIV